MALHMKYKVGISANRNTGKKRKTQASRRTVSSKRTGLTTSGYKYRKIKRYSPNRRKGKSGWKNISSTTKKGLKKKLGRAFGIFLGVLILSAIGGTVFIGATLASISASLPNPNKLVDRASAQSTKIYDRGGPEEGQLLYTIYGDQNREFIKIDEVPEHTKWAFLAAEDAEFYNHKGLDLPGLMKAGYGYVFKKQTSRGASTITQQLVKNTLLYDILEEQAYEKTVSRKVKEMLITMQLEQSFSKDEILQLYLNEVALGGTNYGVQAASKAYFGKDVSELTLAESAIMAGLIQSPGIYSPLFGSNPELAVERQAYVLDQMESKMELINKTAERTGSDFVLTQEMIDEAREEEIAYTPARIDIKAPHFVFYVKQMLIEEYGIDRVERGGLTVTTSLDWDLQQIAEEEITAGVDRYRAAHNVNNGSMVVMDPKTGQVLALVGSYDYWAEPDPKVDGNVNVATSLRQMGSSVKPYTYLTAFSQGYSPSLLTPDIPLNFGYEAQNWDDRYNGLMLARQALVESRNIPALYTMQLIGGPDAFIKTAETLGITTLTERDRYGLSLTLGAGEMKLLEHVGAFSVFANGGTKYPISSIMKVQTYDGEVLEEYDPDSGRQVWDEKQIYLLNWVICDLGGQGRIFPQYYRVGDQLLCGKTGTTDGPRDLSTILYYPNLVVGVWTGNNNNDVTIGNAGQGWSTTVPLPIANSFISRVIGRFGQAWYTRPAEIVTGTVCSDTGLRAEEDSKCNKVPSVFIQGKLPPVDNSRVEKPICKSTGKIATNEKQASALGLIEYKTFLTIDLPLDGHQATLDAWLAKNEAYSSMATLPEEAECPLNLGPNNAPVITIETPSAGSTYDPGDTVSLTVDIRAITDIKNVVYAFDGILISSVTSKPYSYTYTIPPGTTGGTHTFNATVTDKDNKTGTDSVTITVTGTASDVDISIDTPLNNGDLDDGESIQATVSGNTALVTGVSFWLEGPSTIPLPPATSIGGNRWRTTYTGGAAPGDYWLYARANVSSGAPAQIAIRVTID
jgi:membrane peptidoglycan carboxypeptidase